jgi:hypothetical protein
LQLVTLVTERRRGELAAMFRCAALRQPRGETVNLDPTLSPAPTPSLSLPAFHTSHVSPSPLPPSPLQPAATPKSTASHTPWEGGTRAGQTWRRSRCETRSPAASRPWRYGMCVVGEVGLGREGREGQGGVLRAASTPSLCIPLSPLVADLIPSPTPLPPSTLPCPFSLVGRLVLLLPVEAAGGAGVRGASGRVGCRLHCSRSGGGGGGESEEGRGHPHPHPPCR